MLWKKKDYIWGWTGWVIWTRIPGETSKQVCFATARIQTRGNPRPVRYQTPPHLKGEVWRVSHSYLAPRFAPRRVGTGSTGRLGAAGSASEKRKKASLASLEWWKTWRRTGRTGRTSGRTWWGGECN